MAVANPYVAGGALLLGGLAKGYNYFQAGKDKRAAEGALAAEQAIPYAQYTSTPSLNQYYSGALNGTMNSRGFTGAERANYTAGIDRTVNTLANNAQRGSGGNMSRYIIGALNPAIISANNDMLAKDAGLRRANEQSAYGRLGNAVNTLQAIQDRNTQGEIMRKQMREQYLGNAVLQNKAFQSNTLDSLGSDLMGGGLMMGMGGFDQWSQNRTANQEARKFRRGLSLAPPAYQDFDPNSIPPELQ
jgi:hypothetical protein